MTCKTCNGEVIERMQKEIDALQKENGGLQKAINAANSDWKDEELALLSQRNMELEDLIDKQSKNYGIERDLLRKFNKMSRENDILKYRLSQAKYLIRLIRIGPNSRQAQENCDLFLAVEPKCRLAGVKAKAVDDAVDSVIEMPADRYKRNVCTTIYGFPRCMLNRGA